MSDYEKLVVLHTDAVKKAMRFDSATGGTVTRRNREVSWLNAETRFKKALAKALGVKAPEGGE